MLAKTAILSKQTFSFYVSCSYRTQTTKPGLFIRVSGPKLGFSCKVCSRKAMTKLFQVKQQRVFVGRSNQFALRPDFEAGLNRVSKWLVVSVLGVIILWRHDAEAFWATVGSFFSYILCVTLKKILNQERPDSTLRSDPGMPSSHALSIFYHFTLAIWSLVEWFGVNEVSLVLGAVVLALASYLSWLRVSQQLHTMSQVVVGAATGCVFSILWIWSWNAVVAEAFAASFAVRMIVTLGAAAFCFCFLLYVTRCGRGN